MTNIEHCKWGRYRVVPFTPGDLAATRRNYIVLGADGISMSVRDGCSIESQAVLREFKGLKILLFRGLKELNMDALATLPDLEEISLDDAVQTIDLSMLPTIRKLSGDWSKNLLKNVHRSNVTTLCLSKFKSTTSDLADFPSFPKLRELELMQSSIQSLYGISRFFELRRIELHHMAKLSELGDLRLPNLSVFVATACKKISDHEKLASCENLEELKLHDCGIIKSLSFIEELKKLKTFRFMKTDVLDGDLSPLLRLDDVYFTEKKNFSHKTKDMKQRSYFSKDE